ncbi:MAG TPA: diaminopimelate epimerase [Candidatus Helicobacter avicola]|nr:diaminopimelate epimerase [Candidatus Helicobacter avicola]
MRLVKYCANGNDFLIYNAFGQALEVDYAKYARKWCARHSGIGADGFVVLKPSAKEHIAYEWEFFNADGSVGEMCGNASRCVGSFAYVEGIAPRVHTFLSLAGEIGVEVDCANPLMVESVLGRYTFSKQVRESSLWGEEWYLLDTGVPHLVCLANTQCEIPKPQSSHNAFLRGLREKYNANITIACVQNREDMAYASYERGVEDITLACGTGAVAAVAAAHRLGLVDSQVRIMPPGGEILEVRIDSKNVLYLKGFVQRVAVCEVETCNR